jgi:hypothetical protein
VVASETGRRELSGAVRPASSPLRVWIAPVPPRVDRQALIITVVSGIRPEGPVRSGVNGLNPGPLRLLGRRCRQARGLPQVAHASLSPLSATHCESMS